MTDPTDLTRRTVLTLGSAGAVGSALALAGCAADAPTGSASPTTTPSPTVSDEPTTGQLTAAPDAPPVGEDIAALADVPVGGSIDATINGAPALVAQPTAGQVVAFSAICTHQQCVVVAAGNEFDCPCHGSRYDAATGDVLNGPALEPLSAISVAVSGDRIVATS
ncbi:nitrite reductase/ring-hydroxylating ferredoxin subunit [Agromyces ramosus]|uniref:Cytochrome bc1 complex Rieske iron-sulfur subunit n=1 Tax=Agromyces ramosus TaxID=33879 RepID=A0A4Q7MEZ1_9MICO|nr:Rieske (2Fe-2S) protein [Agromyces ramosus]RZS66097.1 nitrite reductase/ring-hydroxylating ferredoxin subunit [Agromyces ramosus]